jgi:hypothetical protein
MAAVSDDSAEMADGSVNTTAAQLAVSFRRMGGRKPPKVQK